ncbi:MAG TPA: hypothetical protein VG406_25270 [Isosphaeraceae bacterium]|jgi:hypothetical protein|nr:hypothetical protein [Isosphaeraceae bacterium]
MSPNLRPRRPVAPALALLALASTARPAVADDPRPYRHNPVQAVFRQVLHREAARPLPLTGYAGYNYAQAPHRRIAPMAAVRQPAPLGARLGRLFPHP